MHDNVSSPTAHKTIFPWFYGWNVVAAALMAVAAALGIVIFSFTFLVMSWMEEFGTSRAQAMLALSATQIMAGFFFPVVGYALDRYSIRWIAICGILCLSAGLALVSIATSIWQIIVIYGLVLSAADAMAGPILAQTLAAKWFRARRGLALGVASLGTSIGGFVFPPLVAFLLLQYGWRSSFLFLAVLATVVLAPILLLIVRNSPQQMGIEPEPESKTAPKRPDTDSTWTTKRILKERGFWFIVIGFLPLMEMTTGLISNLGPYTQDIGIDAQSAAYLISLWSLTMIMGKVCFGALADRLDHRMLYYAGVGFLAVALVLLASQPTHRMLAGIIVILGLATGGQLPLVAAMVGRYFGPVAFGSVMGLFYLCIRPVAFAGPIAGWVRDYFGTYDVFWIAGLIIVLICCPSIYFVRARGRDAAEQSSAPP